METGVWTTRVSPDSGRSVVWWRRRGHLRSRALCVVRRGSGVSSGRTGIYTLNKWITTGREDSSVGNCSAGVCSAGSCQSWQLDPACAACGCCGLREGIAPHASPGELRWCVTVSISVEDSRRGIPPPKALPRLPRLHASPAHAQRWSPSAHASGRTSPLRGRW